jgi:pyruvate formate lyase activating enzyme
LKFKAWQKTSLIEYPGKLSTVLFVGGCNFRCPFCYNASLVLEPEATPDLPGETVLDYLDGHRSLYQAAVVTGGEPTLREELPEFLQAVKSLGLLAGLETNGSRPALLERLLRERLVDFVAMDLKGALEPKAYRRAAGLDTERAASTVEAVRESLGRLAAALSGSGVEVELRCTVVPSLHSDRDLRKLAAELAAAGFPRLVLQQFRPERALEPALRSQAPFAVEELERLRATVARRGIACDLRGL